MNTSTPPLTWTTWSIQLSVVGSRIILDCYWWWRIWTRAGWADWLVNHPGPSRGPIHLATRYWFRPPRRVSCQWPTTDRLHAEWVINDPTTDRPHAEWVVSDPTIDRPPCRVSCQWLNYRLTHHGGLPRYDHLPPPRWQISIHHQVDSKEKVVICCRAIVNPMLTHVPLFHVPLTNLKNIRCQRGKWLIY